MLVALVACAPWLVAIAWIVHRHGLGVVLPRDEVVASYGDLARRRSTVS
jgi:hypothetical protein